MTASSDTLRSAEPPSPAGPLNPKVRDPLVHTGRVLRSGLDSQSALFHHIMQCPAVFIQVTLTDCMELIIRGQCNWLQTCSYCAMYNDGAPQHCVCVFIRGDSSAQWDKDAVNHNQMGVCVWGGEGEGVEEVGGGVCVS
ncbi:hypothetical protein PBY51_007749 [Eleginops maclovinus]|uniref:Uncharacterized protein n=1 Tax=Eleginops maclovinus TaxID=56733 RepID=A0AAN7X894_ELEMC|nr:hypothetical protein PBY51_007749 [Eleginops maclovinus]